MTIIMVGLIPDGIILAADSRQVRIYKSGFCRVDSDTAQKIIPINSHVFAIVSGQGYYYQTETESPKSIYSQIRSISNEFNMKYSVKDIAIAIHEEITHFINNEAKLRINQNSNLTLFIGGYDKDNDIGELFRCVIPGDISLERKTNDAGIVWNGQDDIINRLILGYDPRIFELINISNEAINAFIKQKNKLQLNLNFQTMTIHDAISLVESLISTTITLQNLSSGIVGLPDVFPVCGGELELAVVTQHDGFTWIRHKRLGN
ncbi:MAG: hypothetical protein AB2L18_07385 [Anaerolineaceae bacterium]